MKQFIDAYTFNSDGIYKDCIRVQLCPVTCTDYLLPSDAVLEQPPEHDVEKEYAFREGDKWLIRPRLAGTYWHKKTVEQIEITDPYRGSLDSYTTTPPPFCNQGDKVMFKDDQWELVMGEESLSLYQNKLMDTANLTCQTAITAQYPMHKQFNMITESLVSGEGREIQVMHDFINMQRANCKLTKRQIKSASQAELQEIENNLTKVGG